MINGLKARYILFNS